jgi:hypothetical protein
MDQKECLKCLGRITRRRRLAPFTEAGRRRPFGKLRAGPQPAAIIVQIAIVFTARRLVSAACFLSPYALCPMLFPLAPCAFCLMPFSYSFWSDHRPLSRTHFKYLLLILV